MLSEWECKKRWKCPTDRELALRAKLNSGWSIHSANVFHKIEAIPMDELGAIESVIQRANEMERIEVERVGRMLCKLENMTRNTLGDGVKTCSMCGTGFGIFRSSFVYCVDCDKAVCEKCRVDTLTASMDICMLCKICSENREVWKKSGGWFYGKFPTIAKAYQEKCEAQIQGSPNTTRAFETWSHKAPGIRRLESYQPPEENHNDHSQYNKDWTMNSTNDINCSYTVPSDEHETDPFESKDWTVNSSIPDLDFTESTQSVGKRPGGHSRHEEWKVNSIPSDLHTLKGTPHIELESFRKKLHDKNKSGLNYLSVQISKLSASCPSLIDLQEPCKLTRKSSIRRKRKSTPAQKNSRTVQQS